MSRLIFHDFDYINPISNLPEGDTLENIELRNQLLMQTSTNGFKAFGMTGSDHSPGRSIYMASEAGSDKRFQTRLGGVKSNLRALKNVQPMVKNKDFSPGIKKAMKDRFSSLEPKMKKKWGSPPKLPTINGKNRRNQMGKILKPLFNRKNLPPWIPSGNTSSVYTNKLSAFEAAGLGTI